MNPELKAALEVLEARASELSAIADEAHQVWADSKGTAGTFDAWTAAISRHQEATSAIYWTKAVIAQLEAEAAVPEVRIPYLAQFSNDALAAMAGGGYYNEFDGTTETATLEEFSAVLAYRAEKDANWLAETVANEVVGDQNSYSAIVASDTDSQPAYSLLVNGRKSEHGTYVNKWGIAYAVARELLAVGIDPEENTGFIAAVLETIDHGMSVIAGNLETGPEFSTVFETN